MKYFNKTAENTVAFDDPNKKRGSGKANAIINGQSSKGNLTVTGNMDDATYNSIKNDANNGGSSGDPFASFDAEFSGGNNSSTNDLDLNNAPTDNSINTNKDAGTDLDNTIKKENNKDTKDNQDWRNADDPAAAFKSSLESSGMVFDNPTDNSINTNKDAGTDLDNTIKKETKPAYSNDNTTSNNTPLTTTNSVNNPTLNESTNNSPTNSSINTNNDAGNDLENAIKKDNSNNSKGTMTINGETATHTQNSDGSSTFSQPNTPPSTSDGSGQFGIFGNNSNAANAPKVDEFNSNTDANEPLPTNSENNNPTDASKNLNIKAETNLSKEISNNTTNNSTAASEPEKPEVSTTSLDDLKSEFSSLKSNAGKGVGTKQGPGPSDYQNSVGDKREYAKKPQIFKGGSWVGSFMDELINISNASN